MRGAKIHYVINFAVHYKKFSSDDKVRDRKKQVKDLLLKEINKVTQKQRSKKRTPNT